MTAPIVAHSHRALTSNAGDAARYAEQLLHRICRRWGMTVAELQDRTGKPGRQPGQRGDSIIRGALTVDWLRELDAAGCLCEPGVNARYGGVSLLTLSVMLNTTVRTVQRYHSALRRYQDRPQRDPGAAATGQALVKGVTVAACQEKSTPRLTGYDRASMEELSLGGGQ